jgi:hypothetical protein
MQTKAARQKPAKAAAQRQLNAAQVSEGSSTPVKMQHKLEKAALFQVSENI